MNIYLVVVLTKTYLQDFIIIHAESPLRAKEIVSKLEKVLDVISVWEEAKE